MRVLVCYPARKPIPQPCAGYSWLDNVWSFESVEDRFAVLIGRLFQQPASPRATYPARGALCLGRGLNSAGSRANGRCSTWYGVEPAQRDGYTRPGVVTGSTTTPAGRQQAQADDGNR